MSDDNIKIFSSRDNPEAMARVMDIVTLYRGVLAPLLNAEIDNLPMNQSCVVSASAMMAGMTVGHMIAVGAMQPRDKRRAGIVVSQAFREGIRLGELEAGRAMIAQHQQDGGTTQ